MPKIKNKRLKSKKLNKKNRKNGKKYELIKIQMLITEFPGHVIIIKNNLFQIYASFTLLRWFVSNYLQGSI